jgi:dolichol-phosphate mannosyltransferase
MIGKKNLSIILPTKDENENLKSLIPRIVKHLITIVDLVDNYEIIVVDDSDIENQNELLMINWDGNVIVHTRRLKDSTLSSAIKLGIELAKYESVCWMDADESMPPEIIKLLLEKFKSNENVVIGSRFVKGGGFKGTKIESLSLQSVVKTYINLKKSNEMISAIILSRILNFVLQVCLGNGVKDWTSGYVLCAKQTALKNLNLDGYGEYFIDFMCNCLNDKLKIIEIGYVCESRRIGKSKTGENLTELIKTGLPYLKITIIQLVRSVKNLCRKRKY